MMHWFFWMALDDDDFKPMMDFSCAYASVPINDAQTRLLEYNQYFLWELMAAAERLHLKRLYFACAGKLADLLPHPDGTTDNWKIAKEIRQMFGLLQKPSARLYRKTDTEGTLVEISQCPFSF